MSEVAQIHLIALVAGIAGLAVARIVFIYFKNTSLAMPIKIFSIGYAIYVTALLAEVAGLIGVKDFFGFQTRELHGILELAFLLVTIFAVFTFKKAFQTFKWTQMEPNK